jgi:hypothetical protein
MLFRNVDNDFGFDLKINLHPCIVADSWQDQISRWKVEVTRYYNTDDSLAIVVRQEEPGIVHPEIVSRCRVASYIAAEGASRKYMKMKMV